VFRQSGESRLVFHDELPAVGRIEDVFGIFLGDLREFTLQRFEPRTFVRWQVRARLTKIRDRLIEESAVDARERFRRR
jgi:hypothetical protein